MMGSCGMGSCPLIPSTNLENGNIQLSRCSDGLQAGRSGFDSRQCNIFLFSIASILALGLTQPPIQRVPGALSPGVKRQGREADRSPTTNAEVKNGGVIPPLPHISSWFSS
jgi:hypothetical protein